jgi:hypothetical protein
MATNRFEGAFEEENGEPVLEFRINHNGESVELRLDYESTAIFTHKEQDSHYDHIFCEMGEDEGRTIGAFIWRQVLPDWEDLKKALDDRDYQHIHSPYPSPMDCEQYELTGLTPPTKEVKVIEEVEDDDVVIKSLLHIDDEISWFLNDTHFFDKREPRNEN